MAKRITSLLLVVLLLAGAVPTALAGAASADEIAALEPVDAEPEVTEVSTAPETTEEPTAPEVTEPATDPEVTEPEPTEESTDPLDDPENLQFQIDTGVYETYILEHMDLALVGSGNTLTPYDLISVKQTLADGEKLDALGGSHTIDGLWADDDGDGLSDYADALLIQKSTDVYLYQVSEDADYLVGYVDTLNASNYRVEDHLFAENTSEGNLLSGCIYDEETGLVYVPVSESIREDEEGLLLIGRVQIQLLYVSAAQTPVAATFSAATYESTSSSLFSSTIRVEVIQPDKETSAVRTVSVSLMDTYISLLVETGDSYIDYVTINGCPIERTDWEYTDGTLLIAQQPASVDSVTVVLKDPEDTSITLGDIIGTSAISTFAYGTSMSNLTSYYPDTWQLDQVPTVGQSATFGLTGTKGHYGATLTFDNNADVKTYYSTTAYSMTEGYYGSYNGGGAVNPIALIAVVTNYTKLQYYPGLIDDWARSVGDGLFKRVTIPAGTYHIGSIEVMLSEDFDGALDCAHIGVSWSLSDASGSTPNYDPSYPESQCVKLTILEVKINADGKSGSMMVGFAAPTTLTQAGTGAYLIRWRIGSTGSLKIVKATSDSNAGAARGWNFNVFKTNTDSRPTLVTGPTDQTPSGWTWLGWCTTSTNASDPSYTWTDLEPGWYAVQESINNDTSVYDLDLNYHYVQVVENETASAAVVTVTNTKKEREVTLLKSIHASDACIEQIKDNPMYSLAGAKYQVSVGGTVMETLTTDANGRAVSAKKYAIGTVITVKEISTPSGFKLDGTTYSLTITDGTNTVYVADEPVFDPPFAITKVDKDTTVPQGNGSFSGAVFKWEYYANTSWSGTPTRTWYFSTDANGVVDYRSSSLASGYASDALYINTDGYNQIPLGTVKITEICNSLGYTVLPDSLYCSISADPSSASGASVAWTTDSWTYLMNMATGNYGIYEPIDTSKFGSLTIQKADKENGSTAPGWASFAGCEFTVYNRSTNAVKIGDAIIQPGGVCCVLTVGSDGKASTGSIFPVGTYEVKETKGNEYYEQNSGWSHSFIINGTTDNPSFTIACSNILRPASIRLEKVGTSGQTVSGAKFLLEWSEDGSTWNPVTKSSDIIMGGCSSTGLDENGCLTTGSDGTAVFTGLHPTIHYRVTEVEAPEGYQLLKEPILVKQLLPENEFQASYQVVNDDVFRLPATGGGAFWKVLLGISLACTAMMLALFHVTGKWED